jgi:hypothetical protein
MTPQQKAKELFGKYAMYLRANLRYDEEANEDAKECALIAVDELIESHLLLTTTHEAEPSIRCKTYWQEVKKEIEKL